MTCGTTASRPQPRAARLNGRLHAIQRERLKWAEKAMSGAVPTDIARDKQKQLAVQLEAVQSQLARWRHVQTDHEQGILHRPAAGRQLRPGLRRERRRPAPGLQPGMVRGAVSGQRRRRGADRPSGADRGIRGTADS